MHCDSGRSSAVVACLFAFATLIGVGLPLAANATSQPRPSVSRLSITLGPTTGGTTVTVSGANFRAVTGVLFGAARGTKVAVHSTTTLTVLTPAHVAGTVDVRVVGKSGTSPTSSHDHFSYEPAAAQVSVGNGSGSTFYCAIIKGVGTAECWGSNGSGEIGIGTRGGPVKVPRGVHGLGPGVQDIAAGTNMACAVTKSDGAKCWGSEFFGQLGNGVRDDNGYVDTPTNVVGLTSGVPRSPWGTTTAASSPLVASWSAGVTTRDNSSVRTRADSCRRPQSSSRASPAASGQWLWEMVSLARSPGPAQSCAGGGFSAMVRPSSLRARTQSASLA